MIIFESFDKPQNVINNVSRGDLQGDRSDKAKMVTATKGQSENIFDAATGKK